MRIDNPEFHALNISEITARQAILEVWFTGDPADLVYLTSHANTDTPDGATVIPNVLIAAPVVSQTLQPTEFHSTNGGGNYEILDSEGLITAKIREMNEAGKSLAGKTIRLRATFEGLAFENSVVVATHQFERLEQDGLSYTFVCLDVQRSAQKDEIFDPVSTILTSNVSATDTTIPVSSTSRFSTVWHGPSYSAEANQDVGYLWIKSGEKVEIVAWTGKTATSFTGCVRGRFGTIPQDWEALDSEGESNELEVVEFIYLELPVAKLVYAVLTGNLYGDTGKHLPAHWTPDISEAWVDTASFVSIGSDIWDPADDTAGKVCFFAGLQKISAKKFIYTELLPLIGCYIWITENGEIALRRITDILSSAAHVVELNESNVVSTGAAAYRHNEITNYLRVDWSYDPIKKSYLRTSSFIDDASATKYPDAKQRKLELKGLHGSRHSRDAIRHTFAVMRDQLSSEPIYLSVEGFPALNTLQVGDIVRGNWQHLPDYTDAANLNRAFEVRAVSCDWLNGAFPTLQLFGTTRKASVNPDDDPDGVGIGYGIPDAFYDEGGVDIETAFPSAVTRVGSLVTLTSDITFAGPNALTNSDGSLNSAAVLRVNGDFQVADGVTLSWTRNLALKVKGFFQCNGLLDGVAGGGAGGDYRRTYQDQEVRLSTAYLWNGTYLAPVRLTGYNATYQAPEPGYVHAGMYGQGPVVVRIRDLVDSGYIPEYTVGSGQIEIGDPAGRNVVSYSISGLPSVPSLDMDGNVRGLPSTLIGGGGPAGGHVYTYGHPDTTSPYAAIARAHGTNGGAGGAGLVTISRGMSFGPNGRIDTSGGDAATDAGTYTLDMEGPGDEVVLAGRGCGGSPGSWYCVIDGADSTAPLVSALNFWAFYGDGDSIGNPRAPARFNWYQHQTGNDHASNILSVSQQIGGANLWESMHRVQFIVESVAAPGELTPIDEIPPAPTAVGLTESVNVPATPAGNLSTIAALVTPPSPLGSYSHAWVEWRYAGATAWNRVPVAAENETTFTVQANGATVQVRAIAVSTTGVERTDGPIASITLTNVGVNTDYAFEFGFDPVTETYFRVIDNDSGDTVVGLSGGGLAGKVSAGEGSTGYVHLGDKPTSLSGINAGEAATLYTRARVFRGPTAPVSEMETDDIWFDESDNNKPYWYSGSAWVAVRDTGATQEALDAEVVTTGGVVLSTDGAVRTVGKTSVDDAVEGVYLGDEGGDAAFYAGDGALDYIRYKEGVGLQIGPGTKFASLDSIGSDDIYMSMIFHPEAAYFVTKQPVASEVWFGQEVIARLASGAVSGNSVFVEFRAPEVSISPIRWEQDFTLVMSASVLGQSSPSIFTFFGAGTYSTNPAVRHLGVLFTGAGVYVTASNGTAITQQQIATVSGAIGGNHVLRITRSGGALSVSVRNSSGVVYEGSISSGLPSGAMQIPSVPNNSMATMQIWTNSTTASIYEATLGVWKLLRKAI